MSGGRVILRNFSVLMVAQALSMLAGTVSTIWLARHLGPQGYGLIGFGAAFLTYFTVIANLGTDTLGARDVARTAETRADVTGHLLGLRIVLAVVVYAVFLAVVWAVRDDRTGRIVMAIQGAGLLATGITLDFLFQGIERMAVNAWRQVAQAVLILVGAYVLVRAPGDVTLAAALTPAAAGLTALAVLVVARREFPGLWARFDPRTWAATLKAASPFATSVMMNTILLSFDVVMIGFMLGEAAVGIYAVALKLALLCMIPAGMLGSAWFPAMARVHGAMQDMQREGDRFARCILAFGVPAAVIGFVYAPIAVTLLFGDAYAASAPVTAVLMCVVGVMHVRMTFGAPLPAWNGEGRHALGAALGAALNIAGNLWLIPKYGVIGAAYASLASQAVIVLLYLVFYRQAAGALPFRAYRSAVAVGLPLLAVAMLSQIGLAKAYGDIAVLIVGVAGSALAYLVLARFAGLLMPEIWRLPSARQARVD